MIGVIIQARLGSTRLPKKMVLPFYNEKGVFEIILERLKNSLGDIPIVVATTTNPIDDELELICEKNQVRCFRGSETNVLQRFINASQEYRFSKIIRICADNPFLDVKGLLQLYKRFENEDLDYCSFQTSDGTPSILTHYGFWGEGVSLRALKKVSCLTKEKVFLEHVTNFIYSNPKLFKIDFIPIPSEIDSFKNIRMTLDTKEDFILLKEIYVEYHKGEFMDTTNLLYNVSTNEDWMKRMYKQIKLNEKSK